MKCMIIILEIKWLTRKIWYNFYLNDITIIINGKIYKSYNQNI